ncbi:large ribosomal subunit protein bL20-like [Ruditapes philippinarum]|uniref:large ribosomal subunit protein bL20-like n=1 Tax=Ruditapes philippinarum TaxID=129788 RepID=UPI00295BAFCD|nr:large ribosomal subunit protein bL20-like [Ruditapes philippinarum]
MVFLTRTCNALKDHFRATPKYFINLRSPSVEARRNQMKKHNHKYYGRIRNVYNFGVRRMHKAWKYSTRDHAIKEETMDRLYETRIEAACLEHGMDKKYFLTSIAEFDINLNRETLANLSIYEPRTFQTLVEFVKMRSLEIGLQSTKLGSVYGTEPRGITEQVNRLSKS